MQAIFVSNIKISVNRKGLYVQKSIYTVFLAVVTMTKLTLNSISSYQI
jgi:hypothetical protein